MSRKTSRNIKNALKKSAKLSAAAGRSAYSRIGLSSLALGSLTFGMTALAHAQAAASASNADGAKAPPSDSKVKPQSKRRLGNPANVRLASSGTLPANGAGLLAQAAAPQSVPAPTTSASTLQEIVVTGIRGSLERALQIKKMSVGVVDAISAEDIGQFPDASIGEAIARIPGVTVDRGAVNLMTAAGAATSTGAVTGVNVRGFGTPFQEMLSNGRQIASGLGQNFDFGALGSDFVGEVDVHKTPDFSLSTGAVGATINVKFPNPFDNPGFHVRANVSETDTSNDGGFRPSFGGLISDTFADGKFGVLLDFDYHDTHVATDHLDVVGWKGTYLNCSAFAVAPNSVFGNSGCASVGPAATGVATVPTWYPQDMAMYYERADERRKDARVSLQWHPTDSLLVTIDDNYSSSDDHQDRFQFSTWFGSFTSVTQDANGTITNFINDGGAAPTDFNAFVNTTYLVTNTPGINVVWDVTDHWTAELDADESLSQLNPNHGLSSIDADTGYGNGANNYNGGLVTTAGDNAVPYWSAFGPGGAAPGSTSPPTTNGATPADFFGTNPFILGSHVVPLQAAINDDKIKEAKLDATWHAGGTKANFGVGYLQDTFTSAEYDDFSFNGSNNNWQLWSGYGPASNNPGAGVALPPGDFTAFNISNFIPGAMNTGKLPPGVVLYNPYTILSYLETQPINPGFVQTNGYPTPTYPNQKGLPPINICPGCVNNVERKNYAPFVTISHDFSLGGDTSLNARLGMRYEHTEVASSGLFNVPVSAAVPVGDKTAYSFNFGPTTLKTVTSSYGYFLPSVDLNLLVTPSYKVRLDLSRTETSPPNSDLKPNTTYGGRVNALTATSGNPALLPYLSDNVDFGNEWYYASNDYIAVDAFYKHITQFPIQGTSTITLPIPDPSPLSNRYGQPMLFADTLNVNGESADVDGLEITWQQMLPLGFGFQVNGTVVKTNKPYNPTNIELNTTQFALPGIGNSANLIAFYQRHGLQARLAVQYQGRYFLAFGQEQNSAQFGTEPTFIAPTTEVDFSTQYAIDSHLEVFFEALNLTDAQYHTTGRFVNQMLNWVDYGRSYTMGVRAKF